MDYHDLFERTEIARWVCNFCDERVRRCSCGQSTGMRVICDAYQWPGGAPIVYGAKHDDDLCAKCAADAIAAWVDAADGIPEGESPIVYSYAHKEGAPRFCRDCSAVIRAAYGDPEDPAHVVEHSSSKFTRRLWYGDEEQKDGLWFGRKRSSTHAPGLRRKHRPQLCLPGLEDARAGFTVQIARRLWRERVERTERQLWNLARCGA